MASTTNREASIRLTREFQDGPARLWKAWTEPTEVTRWFGSDPDGTVFLAEIEPLVGGCYTVGFRNSDGSEFLCQCVIVEWMVCQKLALDWAWANRPQAIERLSVTFAEFGSGTVLSLEHSQIDPQTEHGYRAGWSTTLDKLERALAPWRQEGAAPRHGR